MPKTSRSNIGLTADQIATYKIPVTADDLDAAMRVIVNAELAEERAWGPANKCRDIRRWDRARVANIAARAAFAALIALVSK